MAEQVSSRLDGSVGVDEILDSIPADAALLLRDHIKGLEAEAGNARALATRSDRLRSEDVAALQFALDRTREERDRLRNRVDDLEAHLARKVTAAALTRLRRLAR
ncbi:hypothetical protein [Nakamurella endophytica]|uniref:Uncharacterized protein n=1 Tax=Nakamurella endophytica TaxID=1748367 RepID=A0A917SWL5_9ACTN|nr:hypothetical protein [Nakamurella endophytica]GGM01504.1 hypothetical protein GCM10011594_21950 [Nakamurella endophytica]